jgi:hypothetical protein
MRFNTIILTSKQIKAICELYCSGMVVKDVAKQLGYSTYIVKKILKENSVLPHDRGIGRRRYKHFNERFFDVIDNESNAYFLGFLFADGSISRNRNSIRVEISEIDKHILQSFSIIIYSAEYIRYLDNTKYKCRSLHKTKSAIFEINSAHMKQSLIKLGCVPNKSLILEWPTWLLDPNLQRHFIRGYIDGDGSISASANGCKQGTMEYSVSITSTINMCQGILNVILEQTGIVSNIGYAKVSATNNITKTLYCHGNRRILKVLDWLYKDATLYLYRKHTKYLELKAQCAKIDNLVIQ